MADQTINGKLEVNGQVDTTQIVVKGHTTQTEPLQAWQDDQGQTLTQVAADGRLQIGDVSSGAPSALLEANTDITPSDSPQRGVQSLGQITGLLSNAVNWAVYELELLGIGGISGIQTAVRSLLTLNNSGDSDQAEGRAADFEVVNQSGTQSKPTKRMVAVRAAVSNADGAYLTDAVGIEADIAKGSTGTIDKAYGLKVNDLPEAESERYALHTGVGPVHFGDYLEVAEQSVVPGAPAAASGLVRIYPKSDGRLYAKDDTDTEYDLTQQSSGNTIGTYVQLPTSPSQGQMHVTTDSPINLVYDGTKWRGLYRGIVTTLPPTSGWSWVNQDTATLEEKGALILHSPYVAANDSHRMRMRSLPTPPFTITALCQMALRPVNPSFGGFTVRDSTTGRHTTMHLLGSTQEIKMADYNSETSYAGGALAQALVAGVGQYGLWLRLEDDNTDFVFSYSLDGLNFITLKTVARTAWLANPDQVGFTVNPGHASITNTLLHWEEN